MLTGLNVGYLFLSRSDFGSVTYFSVDWNPVTKEDALLSDNKHIIYAASKKYAELAVWEWAEAHPDVDVTTSKSIIIVLPINLSYNSH